jgi:glycerophosphoryl diester phosphodiesterase
MPPSVWQSLSRRALLGAVPLAATAAFAAPPYLLIAHRGGIVDEQHVENSAGSIEAAIEAGYWMLEVDIRRTADGEPVLQHDANFRRYYNTDRNLADMTWAEVRALRATPGNGSPIHFEDLCARCAGRTRLMLDIKSDAWPDSFYERLARLLDQHKLLHTAYLLGGDKAKQVFRESCWLSANRQRLREAVERGEDVARRYYLFELGSVLDEEAVGLCRQHNVTPVAAINTFRYTESKRDEQKGAEEDVARLKQLGVVHYQIDSRYEPLFR